MQADRVTAKGKRRYKPGKALEGKAFGKEIKAGNLPDGHNRQSSLGIKCAHFKRGEGVGKEEGGRLRVTGQRAPGQRVSGARVSQPAAEVETT